MGVPGGEEDVKSLLKRIIFENIPNLGKKCMPSSTGSSKSPTKDQPKNIMPRHIMVKMLKVKNT